MKKILSLILVGILMPINIFAYSNFILPGGESVGISINSEGLIIVGFYKVDGEYIAKSTLRIGDAITHINGKEVNNISELTNFINDEINGNVVNVTIKRNKDIIDTKMILKEQDGVLKTGLYVKDSVSGIGTLTYIDPVSKIYGALGHEILLSDTNTRIEVRDGNILESKVTGIDRSTNGNVGSKNARIFQNKKIGTIEENTSFGIFGKYVSELPDKEVLEVAQFNEIKKGPAVIYTVLKDNNIEEYDINIIDVYNNKKDTTKAFSFEVVDKALLSKSGGIVQGMSGSPVIQNNKIIGGVTHVLVDKVNLGYGIYIKTMLKEGEN